MIVAGLFSAACSAIAIEAPDSDSLSNAYARVIQAEHQLLKSELAVEAKKSAKFHSLFADGHASWLESRQQKLVVDILKAKLAAYEQFESQANETLTNAKIKSGSKSTSMEKASIEMHSAMIQELQQELTALRQAEEKLASGVATLPANDPWAEGYRLRHTMTAHQATVVAAEILLLEKLHTFSDQSNDASELVSTSDEASTFTAAWKRPAKNSSSMKLLLTQAELQIQLSQHHLSNETRRLNSLQELAGQGMVTQRSITDLTSKIEAIKDLLKEQRENFSWLKKDLDASEDTDRFYTSVNNENAIPADSAVIETDLPALQLVLNYFELGQANYLKREAMLKSEMYREILSKLEQAVAVQGQHGTSAGFSDVLVRGQQRELEQYRWKIKKTELQRDLAETQIALLENSDSSHSDNINMLVSTRTSSSIPVTLPSRFISSDPFGLQTTYSAFVYNSPRYKARRPTVATRGDYSSVFRPVINRDALSYYRGLGSSRFGSSYGSFNRGYSNGSFPAGFRTFRPPGASPFQFPGSPQTFRVNRFHSNSGFNSYGRSNGIYHSSGPGYYGR